MFASILFVGCNQKQNDNNKSTEDTSAIVDMHNSQISVDWSGIYSGILPCADCEGIRSTLVLNEEAGNYLLINEYLANERVEDRSEGKFTWSEDGGTITLEGVENTSNKYKVGENRLFYLDLEGEVITGDLEDNYVLTKIEPDLLDKEWKLQSIKGQEINSDLLGKLTLQLDGQKATVNGYAGCNNFNGSAWVHDNNIELGKVAITQAACDAMDTEAMYMSALNEVNSYELKDGKLILKSNSDNILEFENM